MKKSLIKPAAVLPQRPTTSGIFWSLSEDPERDFPNAEVIARTTDHRGVYKIFEATRRGEAVTLSDHGDWTVTEIDVKDGVFVVKGIPAKSESDFHTATRIHFASIVEELIGLANTLTAFGIDTGQVEVSLPLEFWDKLAIAVRKERDADSAAVGRADDDPRKEGMRIANVRYLVRFDS